MSTNGKQATFSWDQMAIIGLGALVFVLLLFANKTNLDNNSEEGVQTGSRISDSGPEMPPADVAVPVVRNEALAEKLSLLEQEEDKSEKVRLLREIVEGLQQENAFDKAGDYAARLAALEPSADNYVVAGALYRFASQQNNLRNIDSLAFRELSSKAIAQLEQAVELDPANEGALIELGLALIESGQPQSGMQGIMKIREVTEINPQNVEASFHLGVFSFDTGQFEKAETRFEKVLELDPENLIAQYYLGLIKDQLGDGKAAKDIMMQLAEQDTDSVLAQRARIFLENN